MKLSHIGTFTLPTVYKRIECKPPNCVIQHWSILSHFEKRKFFAEKNKSLLAKRIKEITIMLY
jgi:hypothetical protein